MIYDMIYDLIYDMIYNIYTYIRCIHSAYIPPSKERSHPLLIPPRTAFSSKGNTFDPFRKLRTVRRGGRGALLTEKLRGRNGGGVAPVTGGQA